MGTSLRCTYDSNPEIIGSRLLHTCTFTWHVDFNYILSKHGDPLSRFTLLPKSIYVEKEQFLLPSWLGVSGCFLQWLCLTTTPSQGLSREWRLTGKQQGRLLRCWEVLFGVAVPETSRNEWVYTPMYRGYDRVLAIEFVAVVKTPISTVQKQLDRVKKLARVNAFRLGS